MAPTRACRDASGSVPVYSKKNLVYGATATVALDLNLEGKFGKMAGFVQLP